jgi:hypothetical protein
MKDERKLSTGRAISLHHSFLPFRAVALLRDAAHAVAQTRAANL